MTANPASTDQAEKLYQDGKLAVSRNDFAGAETMFRHALQLDSSHVRALHFLASVMVQQNRRADAEALLIQAVPQGVLMDSLRLLAEIFETSDRLLQATTCYEGILQNVPTDYGALMKLGELREKQEDKAGACDFYRRAMAAQPANIDAVFKYADAVWGTNPEDAVRALETLLTNHGGTAERRASILAFLMVRKEWWERIRRGEMPYHCARLDELFFNYAGSYLQQLKEDAAAVVAADPANARARALLGTAEFCLKDRHAAEAQWQPETRQGSIWETVRFSPSFYDQLKTFSDEDLVRGLPPVQTLLPPQPDAKGTLYLSCNEMYFRAFALPMIISLHERSPATSLHMHIMDIDPAGANFAASTLKKLSGEKFSLSVERPGLDGNTMPGRCYYHAIRLIRFYGLLRDLKCPLWLMDVDAVVNRSLTDLFDMMRGNDVAMRIRPGRLEAWNQFNACVVGANPSDKALAYFKLIAAYTAYFHQRDKLRWGIDQLAMYGVFADMQDRGQAPTLTLLGEREVDYDYRDDGFIWCNSGAPKFKHLQRIASGGIIPADERNKFSQVFEQYWKQTQELSASHK